MESVHLNDFITRYNTSLIKDYENIPPEVETDNIEYKRYLLDFTRSKLEKRTSQMLNRLVEGYEKDGKCNCSYLLGINDNGKVWGLDKKMLRDSMNNLKKIIRNCNNNAKIDYYVIKKIKHNKYIAQVNIIADEPIFFIRSFRVVNIIDNGKMFLLALYVSHQVLVDTGAPKKTSE